MEIYRGATTTLCKAPREIQDAGGRGEVAMTDLHSAAIALGSLAFLEADRSSTLKEVEVNKQATSTFSGNVVYAYCVRCQRIGGFSLHFDARGPCNTLARLVQDFPCFLQNL